MENDSGQPLPSKDEVIAQVIDIFIREIGFIERHEVSPKTHIVNDFRIDTDDLSWFAEAVVKHFRLHVMPQAWLTITPTIEGIAEFVLRHLEEDRKRATP